MNGAHIPNLSGARIGPNAITQLIAVLDRVEGRAFREGLMARSGVPVPEMDSGMIPEGDAKTVHNALRECVPERSGLLLRLAGLATGDYILQHRIPVMAQRLIRFLPAPLGARVLSMAIARHAWTFAGSGSFALAGWSPLTFKIVANPLVHGQRGERPLCHWHEAVFEKLFSELVWKGCRVQETACCAAGGPACVFEIQSGSDHKTGREDVATPEKVRVTATTVRKS